MNLFTDTIRDATNGTDLFFNISSIPSFNSSLLDWANFTGLNGKGYLSLQCFSVELKESSYDNGNTLQQS